PVRATDALANPPLLRRPPIPIQRGADLMMAIGVYSCRVLYFTTLEEAQIPFNLTGTAVGLASIVGYTPDIFSGPMFGILLDNPDGVLGLQNTYKVLAVFGIIGFICSYLMLKLSKRKINPLDGS
ncbi:MAG: hypothetical protein AAGH46_06845, partial [Bacteroidota bacterium]